MTKKQEREFIFNKFGGKCAYCGEELQKGWHIDEILPVVRGQKYITDEWGKRMWCDVKNQYKTEKYVEFPERFDINNQYPACPSCNRLKSSSTLEGFRSTIKGFINSLNQYHTQYKFAKRYGLVIENDIDVVFYFEKVEALSEQDGIQEDLKRMSNNWSSGQGFI